MTYRNALALPLAMILTACSSEDIETANFGSSINKNQYNLVNASQYEIAFHMANTELDGDQRDVEADKYRVKVLAAGREPSRISHEHNVNREISFFAKSVNQLGLSERRKFKVSHDQDYHFVVQQNNRDTLDIAVVERQRNDQDSVFSLRILAAADMTLSINGDNHHFNQGQVSGWYRIDDCNSDILLEDEPLSLCQASFDRSYLVVVSEQGLQALVLE